MTPALPPAHRAGISSSSCKTSLPLTSFAPAPRGVGAPKSSPCILGKPSSLGTSHRWTTANGPLVGGGSCPTLATPWTIAHQAPLSMGFSRQEHWSGLPLPSPGDPPAPGIEPWSPALQADPSPTEPQGKPQTNQRGVSNSGLYTIN